LISPALRGALDITEAAPVAGGCIHRCYRIAAGGTTRFLKTNEPRFADAFGAEADGLAALHDAGARVPRPIAHGTAGGDAYLVLEFLDLQPRSDFGAMGRMLARLHRRPQARFGWCRDNFIGATPQLNGWNKDWAAFWREQRLRPQLELARRAGFVLAMPDVGRLLENYQPRPSLLHGDLWSGNAGFTADGEPVVFDPAVYCGDREADLAMTELFGGFPREFYSAYEAVWPLEPGYAKRKHLYNLYHLLNHLNLFGGGYLAQVRSALRLLGN